MRITFLKIQLSPYMSFVFETRRRLMTIRNLEPFEKITMAFSAKFFEPRSKTAVWLSFYL